MRYYIRTSNQSPGKWRICHWDDYAGCVQFVRERYETREAAEIACALLNLASE